MSRPPFPTVAYIVTVHGETEAQIMACIQNIREFHGHCPILVINDGEFRRSAAFNTAVAIEHAFQVPGRRLKKLEHGPKWWLRWLEWATVLGCDYTVKMDCDTRIHLYPHFRQLPILTPGICGSKMSPGEPNEHIQGGFQIINRPALPLLARAANDTKWYAPESWMTGESQYFIDKGEISTDYLLAAIAKAAGVSLFHVPWLDCRSIFRPGDQFDSSAVATHPHKEK